MLHGALANLPGKTLAVATEQPADYMAATHVLNAIISGEPVTVDRKYRDAVTITPRAKLAWAMNELPRVKGAGNGVFRRVKVVTFPAIPEHERRPELKELVSLLRRSSNNLNQLTRKVHETGRIYDVDLEDISQRQEKLWEGVKEILTQLSKLS